jgi:predicted small lipoprotein YifL
MKTVSHLALLVIAIATLTACDAGKGPSKPAAESATSTSTK